ncbi:hypothetical protein Gohar_027690 [Gossypium harknessii]|uniref:F-box domain-containing protein n=1 Tax=Gossypium harknessii TaxID=34285 RepID=A0A7J9HVL3_9ROSI|nr:hypothetical protein [Gossypium harknessii]
MKRPRFELSEALMMEVISKLPVKSLTRFNCVCKYWCSSFRTPHFVSKHYHNNLKNNNVNLLLQQRVAKTYTHVFSQISTEEDEILLIKQNIHLPFFKDDDILVYGACHGLWCIQNSFMDKVMNGEAWTKQFSIESVPEVSHSLEFWKTGELFLTSKNNEIVLLDLSTQELKKLRIDTCLNVYAHCISLFAYVESLVLINGRQEHEKHITCQPVGEE